MSHSSLYLLDLSRDRYHISIFWYHIVPKQNHNTWSDNMNTPRWRRQQALIKHLLCMHSYAHQLIQQTITESLLCGKRQQVLHKEQRMNSQAPEASLPVGTSYPALVTDASDNCYPSPWSTLISAPYLTFHGVPALKELPGLHTSPAYKCQGDNAPRDNPPPMAYRSQEINAPASCPSEA